MVKDSLIGQSTQELRYAKRPFSTGKKTPRYEKRKLVWSSIEAIGCQSPSVRMFGTDPWRRSRLGAGPELPHGFATANPRKELRCFFTRDCGWTKPCTTWETLE